ncbi:MAG TPA: VWA domain-containing protein [Thermoanaerobaculia bacterium]|nr:VWA domain-containing protein [Thermoanaerobaculia bacterium]
MTATRLRLRWLAALAVLALAAGMIHAQTPTVTSDISVTLVEIPVEVTQGNEPVRGLTAADFEVKEGNRTLPIVAFEAIDLEAQQQPDAPPPPPAARRHVLFLFDFAMSKPENLEDGIAAARELVAGGLDPRDMVAVGIYVPTGELQLLLSFTTDRNAAARTLGALEGALTAKIPEKSPADEVDPLRLTGLTARSLLTHVWHVDERNFANDMLMSLGSSGGRVGSLREGFLQKNVLSHSSVLHQPNVEARQRGHVMAMADAVEGLARVLRPVQGRKYLAFFSEGFGRELMYKPSTNVDTPNPGGSNLLVKLKGVFEEMRRSGWVLHAVNIAGARGGLSADGLFYMANETGGTLVEGTNDLSKGLGGAMRRSVHSYLVSVQVDDVPFDGSYHELQVRLRNTPRSVRGVRVHHRGGYFAPLPFQKQDDVRRLAEAARLVSGDEESDDLGVEVVAVPLRSGGEATTVAVLVEVPGDKLLAAGAPRLGVEVYGYALDETGSSRDFFAQSVDLDPAKVQGRLAQGGVRVLGKLELPRGEHRLRVLVRDRADGRTSLLTVPLSLRSAGGENHIDALFLPPAGDPWILVLPADPASTAFDLHGRSIVPAAQATLPASGEVQVLVVGHGLAGDSAVLRGRILNNQGKPAAGGELELLAVTPGESGEPDLVVGRLSAGSLPPGSYLLELRLGSQRIHAVSARPFQVSSVTPR